MQDVLSFINHNRSEMDLGRYYDHVLTARDHLILPGQQPVSDINDDDLISLRISPVLPFPPYSPYFRGPRWP